MVKMFVFFTVLAIACSKGKGEEPPPLRKVDSQAGVQSLLGQQSKAPVKKSPMPDQVAKMPDDEVHRGMQGEPLSPHELPPSEVEGEGVAPPLRLKGLGSLEELKDALASMGNVEKDVVQDFERGFRLTFTIEGRDYEEAKKLMEGVLKRQPNLAEAYRVLAFITLSENFNADGARALYEKALSLRNDYKEVHYALAVLYLLSDREKGKTHFEKAMALGQPDYQNLARFYGTKFEQKEGN